MEVQLTRVKNVLTRTSGFLKTVTSHSLQPYRGCTFGRSLCGIGCYVQHNRYLTKGRRWGEFLDVRSNAAASYLENRARERRWARRTGDFSVFLSSSTEPFMPAEFRYGITRAVLAAMEERPPDRLILQTHSHRVAEYLPMFRTLARRCDLRVHVSIESDRSRLPGLPAPASSVEHRFAAAQRLKEAGIWTVITVAPLLPIADPGGFFARIATAANAVVLDHFIGGDGTADGNRTRRTPLPRCIAAVCPEAVGLAYRDTMVEVAHRHLPGRVGVNTDGFAGRFLPTCGVDSCAALRENEIPRVVRKGEAE